MNRIKRASTSLYAWFWYTTQFWLDPESRRPYTFIMRDIYHNSPMVVVILLAGLFYCLGRWWLPISSNVFLVGFLALLAGCLLGHLFWGDKWIPGQQEDPEYNPMKDNPREFYKGKL